MLALLRQARARISTSMMRVHCLCLGSANTTIFGFKHLAKSLQGCLFSPPFWEFKKQTAMKLEPADCAAAMKWSGSPLLEWEICKLGIMPMIEFASNSGV